MKLPHDEEPWYDPDSGRWHLGPYFVTAEFAMRWRDQRRMGTDEWYRECVEALDGD